MVEFETLESASKARTSLHGCDIYNNCCTMKVEYSKMETLKVRENGPMSWDFTILNRDEGMENNAVTRIYSNNSLTSGPPGARPVILNEPDMMDMGGGGGGGNNFMSNMRNMDMMSGGPGPGPGYQDMMGGGGGRGDDRSCVVVVHNLAMGEVNCDRLFNLVCQYGNVTKIFFMKTKPGCAMMEMSDHEGAQRVISNIQVRPLT